MFIHKKSGRCAAFIRVAYKLHLYTKNSPKSQVRLIHKVTQFIHNRSSIYHAKT